MDPAIDLVRDHPHLAIARPLRDRLDLSVGVHGPGGIARRAQHETLGARNHAIQVPHAHLQAPFGIARDEHRPGAAQIDDLWIRHPRGRRDGDHVAGAEQGEAHVEERLLRPVGHDDVVGVHGPAAREQREVLRPGGPELEDPLVRRVVGLPLPDGANPGVRRDGWRGEVGLSRPQIDHVLARRLAALRLLRDRDGRGRLEVLQVGRQAGRRGHARDDSPVPSGHATTFPCPVGPPLRVETLPLGS